MRCHMAVFRCGRKFCIALFFSSLFPAVILKLRTFRAVFVSSLQLSAPGWRDKHICWFCARSFYSYLPPRVRSIWSLQFQMDPNQYYNGGQPNYYQQQPGTGYTAPPASGLYSPPPSTGLYGSQPAYNSGSGGVYVGANAIQGTGSTNMYQAPAQTPPPASYTPPPTTTTTTTTYSPAPAAQPAATKPTGPQPGGSTSYNPYFYKVVLLGEGGVGSFLLFVLRVWTSLRFAFF